MGAVLSCARAPADGGASKVRHLREQKTRMTRNTKTDEDLFFFFLHPSLDPFSLTKKQDQSLLVARPLGPAARDALQSPGADGSAEANAGGAQLRHSSSAAVAAADGNAEKEDSSVIGGGIFKAISDAASQEGPLQGKAFDSYAFGPPVSSWFFAVVFLFVSGKRRRRSTHSTRSRSSSGSACDIA